MNDTIELDAYLTRIGHKGGRTPTLDVLSELHLEHPQAIAFENLDPFLGRPVRLDPESLETKIVRSSRGGYCFEHNLIFAHVLRALGFRVTGLAARVVWNRPEEMITARGHMLLAIDLDDGRYIADVGFGGLTLTAPLRFEPGVEQATPHEPFRIMQTNGDYRMQVRIGDDWQTLYRFDLQEQFEVDYEVTNYFLSTNPTSHFRTGLICARAAPGRRYALLNNQFAVHHLGGPTERRMLETVGAMRDTLEQAFGLTLSDDSGLEPALARLI